MLVTSMVQSLVMAVLIGTTWLMIGEPLLIVLGLNNTTGPGVLVTSMLTLVMAVSPALSLCTCAFCVKPLTLTTPLHPHAQATASPVPCAASPCCPSALALPASFTDRLTHTNSPLALICFLFTGNGQSSITRRQPMRFFYN